MTYERDMVDAALADRLDSVLDLLREHEKRLREQKLPLEVALRCGLPLVQAQARIRAVAQAIRGRPHLEVVRGRYEDSIPMAKWMETTHDGQFRGAEIGLGGMAVADVEDPALDDCPKCLAEER